MSDDSNGDFIGTIVVLVLIWMIILSIPVAVVGDLSFYFLIKSGVLSDAPKFLIIASWLVPALVYGYYIRAFIINYITYDSTAIALLMYAQGFFLLGITAAFIDEGVLISKIIILGFNHILGGGWLAEYTLMFGISILLFILGLKIAFMYPSKNIHDR